MTDLSDEQKTIVELPLGPLAVTACAGSGKTKTAVHRLAEMRRRIANPHARLALLSFSNVAVDTFRREYVSIAGGNTEGVDIDTVDGFITSNVLRPHSHRTMECNRTPFLVDGREPFLNSFTVYDGQRPRPTTDIEIGIEGNKFSYTVGLNNKNIVDAEARRALTELGKKGAYTHRTAPYWVIRTLAGQGFVLRALARRYPHILVDEAQDLGPTHQIILRMLIKAGSQLSLIGDPNQGIFEFSNADGKFLAEYGGRAGVMAKSLATNYRSVPEIVTLANRLCGRKDMADRPEQPGVSGAYFIPYKKPEKQKALSTFASMLQSAGIPLEGGIILCRGNDGAIEWGGGEKAQGQKVIKAFAEATIARDQLKRFGKAFECSCVAVSGLLDPKHDDLISRLVRPVDAQSASMRRAIWNFVRNPVTGLPSGELVANAAWHAAILVRAKDLVDRLAREFGVIPAENLGRRLAKTGLLDKPLVPPLDLAQAEQSSFRVSTVHKVKGESIDGVMYVVSKDQAEALLGGATTELGRIGYVAVTRARDLFVLAVPENSLALLEPNLRAAGFKKPGV